MLEKYIDEKTGIWIIFGCSTENPNKHFVSDQNGADYFLVDLKTAQELCKAQEEFRNKLYQILKDV